MKDGLKYYASALWPTGGYFWRKGHQRVDRHYRFHSFPSREEGQKLALNVIYKQSLV